MPAKKTLETLNVSNSDAKDSICNRAGLQAVFASAAVLLHSEHSLKPHPVADTIFSVGVAYLNDHHGLMKDICEKMVYMYVDLPC